MSLHQNNANSKGSRQTALAVALLMAGASSMTAANAQYASGGFGNGLSVPTQDSLLPPEVVPIDPSTANSMAVQQAENRAQFGNAGGGQVPGLVNSDGSNGMMSAQDLRKAAFESLYGQSQTPQNQPQTQWQSSGVALDQYSGQNVAPNNQPNGMAPGQNPNMGLAQNTMSSPTYAPYNSAPSQTLSGGSKNPQQARDVRRGGIANTVSSLATLGTGAFLGGALMQPQNMLMRAGVFGMTMSGLGTRNAFRF